MSPPVWSGVGRSPGDDLTVEGAGSVVGGTDVSCADIAAEELCHVASHESYEVLSVAPSETDDSA